MSAGLVSGGGGGVAASGYDPKTGDGDPSLGFATREDYESAVKSFTTTSRSWRHPRDEMERKRVMALDVELQGQSYDGAMYRGVAVSSETARSLSVGDTIDMGGIASFSKKQYVAEGYAQDNFESFGGTRVVYVMGKGTRMGGDVSELSVYKHEAEVTLSSKSSQVITKIQSKNDIMYVHIEEVWDGD